MHRKGMQVRRLELKWSGDRLRALLAWAPQVRFLLALTSYSWSLTPESTFVHPWQAANEHATPQTSVQTEQEVSPYARQQVFSKWGTSHWSLSRA